MLPVRTRRVAQLTPDGGESFAPPAAADELFVAAVERTAWFSAGLDGAARRGAAPGAEDGGGAGGGGGDGGGAGGGGHPPRPREAQAQAQAQAHAQSAARGLAASERAREAAERRADVCTRALERLSAAGAELEQLDVTLGHLEEGRALGASAIIRPPQAASAQLEDAALWARARGDDCRAGAATLRAGAAALRRRAEGEAAFYATVGRLQEHWKLRRTPLGFVVDVDHRRALPRPDGKMHATALLVRARGEGQAAAAAESDGGGASGPAAETVHARLQGEHGALRALQVETLRRGGVAGEAEDADGAAGRGTAPPQLVAAQGSADALHAALLQMQRALMHAELYDAVVKEALQPEGGAATAATGGSSSDGGRPYSLAAAASDSVELEVSQRLGLRVSMRPLRQNGAEGGAEGDGSAVTDGMAAAGAVALMLEARYGDWCAASPRGALSGAADPPQLLRPACARLLQSALRADTLATLQAAASAAPGVAVQRLQSSPSGDAASYRLSAGEDAARTVVVSHPVVFVEGSAVPLMQLGAMGGVLAGELSAQVLHKRLLRLGLDVQRHSGSGLRVVLPSGGAAVAAMVAGEDGRLRWSVAACGEEGALESLQATDQSETAASAILHEWLASTDSVAGVVHLDPDLLAGGDTDRCVHLIVRLAA